MKIVYDHNGPALFNPFRFTIHVETGAEAETIRRVIRDAAANSFVNTPEGTVSRQMLQYFEEAMGITNNSKTPNYFHKESNP